jgi:hypothetical protein
MDYKRLVAIVVFEPNSYSARNIDYDLYFIKLLLKSIDKLHNDIFTINIIL